MNITINKLILSNNSLKSFKLLSLTTALMCCFPLLVLSNTAINNQGSASFAAGVEFKF